MKIYTRTGDGGETSLLGGARVSKSDVRVDAYGEVDETNAWLGLAVTALRHPGVAPMPDVVDALLQIQRDLFALGARLADPGDRVTGQVAKTALGDRDVERLEQLIDHLEGALPPLQRFILAGGSGPGATLHLARTVCRRAERRMVALQPPVEAVLVRYVNRLSDLLFVMARYVNHRSEVPETEW
ncbi:MAG: cob(I)yrinic acid a,c-diamide adenosyltransferase [Acidobacteriota bacterium]